MDFFDWMMEYIFVRLQFYKCLQINWCIPEIYLDTIPIAEEQMYNVYISKSSHGPGLALGVISIIILWQS